VLRAVAVGALLLGSGVTPGRSPLSRAAITEVARATGGSERVEPVGQFWLSCPPAGGRVLLLDQFGDAVLDVHGDAVLVEPTMDSMPDKSLRATVESLIARQVRHVGPVSVPPTAWVVQGGRIRELADPGASTDHLGTGAAAIIIGRS
jgi:hypothetical protein